MTIELVMLAWTLVLAFIQILLFDMARTAQYGLKWNTGARDEEMLRHRQRLPPVRQQPRRQQRRPDARQEEMAVGLGAASRWSRQGRVRTNILRRRMTSR